MDVFFSADDRQEYLDLLSQSASKHALDFLAWCLMSNHAHFVVVPRQEKSEQVQEKFWTDITAICSTINFGNGVDSVRT
jgi:putative transposase